MWKFLSFLGCIAAIAVVALVLLKEVVMVGPVLPPHDLFPTDLFSADLRGPAPRVGDVMIEKARTRIEDAEFTSVVDGLVIKFKLAFCKDSFS